MNRALSATRFLILIPVLAVFLVALALLIYGAMEGVRLVVDLVTSAATGQGVKTVAVAVVKVIDLLLLGTVLYIIALGLYELFIDDRLEVPAWLEIESLDDLKQKLISGLIVVLLVYFLEQVVAWDGQRELLSVGASIALVIAALAFYLGQKPYMSHKSEKGKASDES